MSLERVHISQKGASLFEVLTAVTLVAIAILAGIGLQTFAFKAQKKASLRSKASIVARGLMARCQADLAADFGATVTAPRQAVPVELDSERQFEYEVQESKAAPPLEEELKQVEVVLYWKDQQGDQSFHLTTKVAAP